VGSVGFTLVDNDAVAVAAGSDDVDVCDAAVVGSDGLSLAAVGSVGVSVPALEFAAAGVKALEFGLDDSSGSGIEGSGGDCCWRAGVVGSIGVSVPALEFAAAGF